MPINRVYWDSCVFIDRIARHPDKIAVLEEISDAAHAGRITIIASTLCIAETCKIKDAGDAWHVTQRLILDFFENPWIEVVQLDSYVAELAQTIAHTHPLSSSDAVHVATAIIRRADVLMTYDGEKGKRKSLLKCHDKILFQADGSVGTTALQIKLPFRIDPQKALEFPEATDESKPRALTLSKDEGPDAQADGSAKVGGQAHAEESGAKKIAQGDATKA